MTIAVPSKRPLYVAWISVLALGGTALAAGCATGMASSDDAPLTATTQSDAGSSSSNDDAATNTAPTQPVGTGDDSAAPTSQPTGDDAAPPSGDDDAAPPPSTVDASPPPVVVDAAPPPPVQKPDAGSTCPGYALPTTTAACNSGCTTHTCSANGCYNGYYCELSDLKCVAKPASCP